MRLLTLLTLCALLLSGLPFTTAEAVEPARASTYVATAPDHPDLPTERPPVDAEPAPSGDARAAAAGTGILAGTLTFQGIPLADEDVIFVNYASGEEYYVTTESDGSFAGVFPAGRWYARWWAIDSDTFFLDVPARAKVVAGKTTTLTLSAATYENGLTFTWPSTTAEEGFTTYLYEEGTDFAYDPLYTCVVDVVEETMECDAPTYGLTLLTEDSAYDVYVVPFETDEFVLLDVETDWWTPASVVLYFEDVLGTLDLDLGPSVATLLDAEGDLAYSFDIMQGKAIVGSCEIEFFEGTVDDEECWGNGLFWYGEGVEFLVPAGSYSLVVRAEGAKDVTVKKLVVKADTVTTAKATLVPNVVSVSVTGAAAEGSWVLLTVFDGESYVEHLDANDVVSGVATFTWVPVGLVVIEALHDDRGSYADMEKPFKGGALKVKLTLK